MTDPDEQAIELARQLIADPALPWIVEPTDDDPHPDDDRLADEPATVVADDSGQNGRLPEELRPTGGLPSGVRGLVAPVVTGINLRDYSRTPQARGWGAPCTAARVGVKLSEATVNVDARIAELVGLIMLANEAQGYRYRRADTGAYNCRKIAGSASWSWHAWAIAVDANWQTNPYTSPLRTDRPQWERDRWNRFGFAGGWDYSGRQDAMHSEAMFTPEQVPALLEVARRELGPIIAGGGGQAPIPAPGGIAWQPRVDAPLGTRVLEVGSVGSDVEFVQRWHGIGVDAHYGPATEAKVRATQQRNGLAVDGVVGPQTWRTMGVGASAPAPPPFDPNTLATLSYGMRGDDRVKALQRFLNAYGWRPALPLLPVTGNYLEQTVAVVAAAQVQMGIAGTDANGRTVGPRTKAALASRGARW